MTNRPANRPANCSSASRSVGGFEGGELLAGAAAQIARGPRSARAAAPAAETAATRIDLLGAGGRDLLEQPRQAPGRSHSAVRLAAPRALGANVIRCGSVATGMRQRRRQASSTCSRATPREVERSAEPCSGPRGRRARSLPRAGRRRHARKNRGRRRVEQREHHVAPRVHVVDGDEQLAEARLPEVLGQQLDVPPRRARPRRRGERRRRRESGSTAPRAQRSTRLAGDSGPPKQAPAQPLPRGARAAPEREPHRAGGPATTTATATSSASSASRGMIVGSTAGANSASIQRAVAGVTRASPRRDRPTSVSSRPTIASSTASASSDERNREDGRAADERPAGDAQRRRQRVEAGAPPATFHSPSPLPEPRAAVDRGEHRADRADAAAGDEIDPDAGFVQRAQHAGVIRARRCRSRSARAPCGAASSTARSGRVGSDHD